METKKWLSEEDNYIIIYKQLINKLYTKHDFQMTTGKSKSDWWLVYKVTYTQQKHDDRKLENERE